MEDYEVKKQDWEHIRRVMDFNKRKFGCIDVVTQENGKRKLEFFDNDPKSNGVSALMVSREQVEEYYNQFTE